MVAIVDTEGEKVVEYLYDAWGRLLETSGTKATDLGVYNPLRYRGYVYDTETGLYYLQSRYYNPELGRFINADILVSTGKGTLGTNMFAYCGNNPVVNIDVNGQDYTLIGGGVQFEFDCGGYSVGVEVIVYWDVDECENGGFQVAVYAYGGVSVGVDNPLVATMVSAAMDNIDLLTSGCEDDILLAAAMLSRELSVSVSGVAIFGDESFTTTESYEGYFTSVSVSGGSAKGGYAYAENCVALSLGKNIVGGLLLPSINVSRTTYKQLGEFNTLDMRCCLLERT